MVNIKKVVMYVIDCIVDEKGVANNNNEPTWIQDNRCTHTLADKETLLTFGSSLTDKYVNYAQTLLRQ